MEMNRVWTFNPSSKALLKRCLAAVPPPDNDNKWARAFSNSRLKLLLQKDKSTLPSPPKKSPSPQKVIEEPKVDDIPAELTEELLEATELDPVAKFNELVEICLKNRSNITALAQCLSDTAVEKVCHHIFVKKDINMSFIDNFYTDFYPAYLKRGHNWKTLDLIMKAQIVHPECFNKLVKIFLTDTEVPSKVLRDYIHSLNAAEKFSFLNYITGVQLTSEQFLHNLSMIYNLYRESKKNERIQDYILSNLTKHSQDGANDKDFARLISLFIQTQSDIGPLKEPSKIQQIIDNHKTSYKESCRIDFNVFVQKHHT